MQGSEIELLQKRILKVALNPAEHNLYTTDTLESNNIRIGRKREVGLFYCLVYLCVSQAGEAKRFCSRVQIIILISVDAAYNSGSLFE